MTHPSFRSSSLTARAFVRPFLILVIVSALSPIVSANAPVPDALASKRLEKLSSASKIPSAHSTPAHAQGLDPDEALARLLKGNARFVSGKSIHPNQGGSRRKSLTASQNPHTIVVSCSDSRVPPEILFDQGLGDLFVVRVAGNVIDETSLGSIEYAAEHLGTRAILVLGHSKCGAVKATVDAWKKGVFPEGHVYRVASLILPAVSDARKMKGDLAANAVSANVRRVASGLRASRPVLAPRLSRGAMKIYGAVYDLDSGRVSRLF